MKKLKVVLLTSVLAIGLGQTAQAVYSQDDLSTLRSLVDQENTNGILAYINNNPQVMTGTDPLAEALRDFVSSREGLLGNIFGQKLPRIANVPDLPDGITSEDLIASGSLSDFGS